MTTPNTTGPDITPPDSTASNGSRSVSVPIKEHPQPPTQQPGRMRRALVIAAIAVTAGVTGAFANNAYSQGFGPPWQQRSMWGQPFDPAAIEDRADKMVRHLSIEVDATPDQ